MFSVVDRGGAGFGGKDPITSAESIERTERKKAEYEERRRRVLLEEERLGRLEAYE